MKLFSRDTTMFCCVLLFLCTSFSSLAEKNAKLNIGSDTQIQKIDKVLNKYHQTAAKGQLEAYFDLFTDDAVLMGTDGSERWNVEEFKAYVTPFFSKGIGWLYTPKERHINFVDTGKVAFFDELLFSESYGNCRGTGVLINTKDGWKIAQYSLSVPMPNDLAKSLIKQIKLFEQNK
jgi:ketosteroid isomerase-like protein